LVSQEALETAETAHRVAVANLDAAQRQVDQARAGLREAQDNLRKTTILAPMGGRITRLAVEEGEVAVPGTFSRETGLLMTISDRRRRVLSVPIIALTVREPSDTLRPDTARGSAKRPAAAGTRDAGRDSTSGKKKEIEGLFVVDTASMTARFRPVRVGIAGEE